mgnify:CR=1 FL=1
MAMRADPFGFPGGPPKPKIATPRRLCPHEYRQPGESYGAWYMRVYGP